MKTNNKYLLSLMLAAVTTVGMTSCEDFLDREPMSSISPEVYYSDATQLEANLMDEYPNVLDSHSNWSYGIFGTDAGTDNQIGVTANDRWTKDRWKVPFEESTDWNFSRIYRINFFLQQVMQKYGEDINGSQNTIGGDLAKIKHYIGEMYFLRAYAYYKKYVNIGDFPIIKEPLPDDNTVLTEASKRAPRNEVARFILEDLDLAYKYMSDTDLITTRINKDVAKLMASRVALFEATWLQNFNGTAFVPGGNGWPGGSYSYPSGSIDAEVKYFLGVAADAAKYVGDKYVSQLTANTGYVQQDADQAANPFHEMFATEDLSGYPEVLMWRQYGRSLVTHNVNSAAGRGNYRTGLTRGFVQNFLMADGSPVYTHGTYADGDGYYMGDKTIADVAVNRDTRLSVFLKIPGQKNVLYELDNNEGSEVVFEEPVPQITNGDGERGYSTGYALRKGGSFNRKHYANGGGWTAAPMFRAAEALLNYMEASYLLSGTLDATARTYWQALRTRAHVSTDIDNTIALTDMSKEAENDWGAYTAGQILTDKTLYNIRRERRCEYMAEGLRYLDLRRWRSMDQLINNPCHLEGMHLWNTPMANWYDNLVYDNTNGANVSGPEKSEYLRPFSRYPEQAAYDGCTWKMAHYLSPIMVKQFQLTATDPTNLSTSVIYQNPYWPTTADQPAEQ